MIGMTQLQLADVVGVRFQQIQKYESGINKLSAARLWMIARALEVPITYFYDGLAEVVPFPAQPCETSGPFGVTRVHERV
jgi:transcriptional regulator with XRE-family HTH domain